MKVILQQRLNNVSESLPKIHKIKVISEISGKTGKRTMIRLKPSSKNVTGPLNTTIKQYQVNGEKYLEMQQKGSGSNQESPKIAINVKTGRVYIILRKTPEAETTHAAPKLLSSVTNTGTSGTVQTAPQILSTERPIYLQQKSGNVVKLSRQQVEKLQARQLLKKPNNQPETNDNKIVQKSGTLISRKCTLPVVKKQRARAVPPSPAESPLPKKKPRLEPFVVPPTAIVRPTYSAPVLVSVPGLKPAPVQSVSGSAVSSLPKRCNVLEAAINNSGIFESVATHDEAPYFHHLDNNVLVHYDMPIMSKQKLPSTDALPPLPSEPSLEVGLAVIDVTPQTVSTSLVSDRIVELHIPDSPPSCAPLSMPLLTDEYVAVGKSMPILTLD